MLFSTLTFVFVFLPVVASVYFLLPSRGRLRNVWLLAASVVFYAWGEPRYVWIMLGTILVNYMGAFLVARSGKWRCCALASTIVLNLLVLGYFKYFNFIVANVNSLLGCRIDFLHVVMPIGISFYTFQAMSYVIDVYRGETRPQRNPLDLALYITLFPQLVAGPIVKYHDVALQLSERSSGWLDVSAGLRRFMLGLSKKMLVANTMGEIADAAFAGSAIGISSPVAWLGAIAYAFQIYYDFSGYSDMAIGLGRIFGFRFLENFNYPYVSRTITEFWRRWHISLSTWFREYLYIPLGGNRVAAWRVYMNLFVVFLVTGVWHGASWNFVVWGAWNGVFIVIERWFGLNRDRRRGWLADAALHAYTCLAFVLGWVFFRAETLSAAWRYFKCMAGAVDPSSVSHPVIMTAFDWGMLAVAAICALPVFGKWLLCESAGPLRRLSCDLWIALLFVLSVAWMTAATYNPFIYFRF